jgi:elongation factor P
MHVKPGKGAAFVRTKVKNLITGNVLDKTFRAGETFPDAPVKKVHAKFSYAENSICSFLADESFEEYRLPEDKLKEWMHFFVVGFPCVLSYYHDQFISLHPPNTFEYTVVGMDGKTAVLDSGAKIAVPPFVAVGDVVQVQIQPLQYMSRSERREEK